MIHVFCTHCKPEQEVIWRSGALETICDCGNVHVLWDVFVEPSQPLRVISIDSRYYRIDLDKKPGQR